MKLARTVTVLMFCMAACDSSSGDKGSTDGGGSHPSNDAGDNGDDNPDIYKNAATGTLAGDVTGTFAHSYVMMGARSSPPPPFSVSVVARSDSDLTAGISLSAPTGASVLQVINTLGFTQTPQTNTTYTESSPTLCGGLVIMLTTGASWTFSTATDCSGSSLPAKGTFSMNLTSLSAVPQSNPGLATFQKASGTIQAHLAPDLSGSGVDVSLSF